MKYYPDGYIISGTVGAIVGFFAFVFAYGRGESITFGKTVSDFFPHTRVSSRAALYFPLGIAVVMMVMAYFSITERGILSILALIGVGLTSLVASIGMNWVLLRFLSESAWEKVRCYVTLGTSDPPSEDEPQGVEGNKPVSSA